MPSLISYIQRVYHMGKPIAGICYGHQVIARALSGRTARNPGGWELSVHRVHLTPDGVRLFGTHSLVLTQTVAPISNGTNQVCYQDLYQAHRDAVIEAPPNVKIIGSSDNCDVQIMYEPGRILSFQGHPEFDRSICESFINGRLRDGELDGWTYDKAMMQTGYEHDGEGIGSTLCSFLIGGYL